MNDRTSVQLTLNYKLKEGENEQAFINDLTKRMNVYLKRHSRVNHGVNVEVKHERV